MRLPLRRASWFTNLLSCFFLGTNPLHSIQKEYRFPTPQGGKGKRKKNASFAADVARLAQSHPPYLMRGYIYVHGCTWTETSTRIDRKVNGDGLDLEELKG